MARRSIAEPRRSALMMPTETPMISHMIEAPMASEMVTGSRSRIREVTLCWYWKE